MEKSFAGQREGEAVIDIVHKHPLVMRKGFYTIIVLLLISIIPMFAFKNPDLIWLMGAALGLGLIIFFYFWIGWYFSVYIITNQRVRQVLQKGLFGKHVIDIPLKKIQNVSLKVKGFSGEVFKYGTIVLQTYVGNLVMDSIYGPEEVYNEILDTLDLTEGEDFNEGKD
jgi:uncharacterized membrane protein YdbT with pleckstrin-like domain